MASRGFLESLSSKLGSTARQSYRIRMQATTWASDSHDLFDYESPDVLRKEFKVNCLSDSYCAIRDEYNIDILPEDVALQYLLMQPRAVVLLKIYWYNSSFYILPGHAVPHHSNNISDSQGGERLWLVVRSVENGVAVTEGDILKLGRYNLRVKEAVSISSQAQEASRRRLGLCDDDCETQAADAENFCENGLEKLTNYIKPGYTSSEILQSPRLHSLLSSMSNGTSVCHTENKTTLFDSNRCALLENRNRVAPKVKQCRICLSSNDDYMNPQVSPCRCKGSMQYVHLECLRTWMESRLNIRDSSNGTQTSFYWHSLDCELCKSTYPTYVEILHEKIELLHIPRPEYPYLILESPKKQEQGFHVICLANNRSIKIGRGHDSDIRISDISVSRLHATIKFLKGDFYVEDEMSKFGTLVEIRKAFKLENSNSEFALQIGRTVLTICVKKHWKILPLCGRSSVAEELDVVSHAVPIPRIRHIEPQIPLVPLRTVQNAEESQELNVET